MNYNEYNLESNNIQNIIKIQKIFKLKRINNYLSKFDLVKLDNEFMIIDYGKTISKLINKELINKVNILMFRINRYLNPEQLTMSRIIGRMFLTLYLLKYHSSDVLVSIDILDRTLIHYQACNIINYLNDLFMQNRNYRKYSMNRFGNMFNMYCIHYNQLQQQDKVNMINEPYRHYANIMQTIKYVQNCGKYPDDQKKDVIQVLEKEITKTYECIRMLDKNFDIKKFDEMVCIEDNIINDFTEAYWDKFKNELYEEKYDELIKLLTKLKNIIIYLHPKVEDVKVEGKLKVIDRETIKKDFDESIDVEYVRHLLINRVMDDEYIIKICSYLMDTVKELQASSRDNELSAMWENMIYQFRERNISMFEFIPLFFKEIYSVIDKIGADVLLIPIVKATTKILYTKNSNYINN